MYAICTQVLYSSLIFQYIYSIPIYLGIERTGSLHMASSCLFNFMLTLTLQTFATLRSPTQLCFLRSRVEALILEEDEARLLKALQKAQQLSINGAYCTFQEIWRKIFY